jgi:GNAT superfamily N-acetyltransferase
MSLIPVPNDQIATIVTSLEMYARPALGSPAMSALKLVHWKEPDLDRYRSLYHAVGTPWLWFSRLVMPDAELAAIIGSPDVTVHAATRRDGTPVGILELDFRVAGQCELSFFGLTPDMTGRGVGGWLMQHALRLAWRDGITRVWVHTCTLDHPAALGFYQRHGFRAYARAVETFADPRLTGHLPRDSAPHVPLFDEGPVGDNAH